MEQTIETLEILAGFKDHPTWAIFKKVVEEVAKNKTASVGLCNGADDAIRIASITASANGMLEAIRLVEAAPRRLDEIKKIKEKKQSLFNKFM